MLKKVQIDSESYTIFGRLKQMVNSVFPVITDVIMISKGAME